MSGPVTDPATRVVLPAKRAKPGRINRPSGPTTEADASHRPGLPTAALSGADGLSDNGRNHRLARQPERAGAEQQRTASLCNQAAGTRSPHAVFTLGSTS